MWMWAIIKNVIFIYLKGVQIHETYIAFVFLFKHWDFILPFAV
jgi:hypothetical protein